jgi:hypothetical protein
VRAWFSRIPEFERDLPIILVDGAVYTPREVLREVEAGTALGLKMQRMLEQMRSSPTQTSDFIEVGRARALKKVESLPEDFSIIAIGEQFEPVVADKNKIKQMIMQGVGLGAAAIDYEAKRAMKLLGS